MKKGALVSGNTLAPFTWIRCYLRTKIFCCCLIWYVLFCFLRFGLSMTTVYPVTTVTENASYQHAFQSGDFWIRLLVLLLRVDGRKREVYEYHDVINHMPRVALVFPSFLNCEDGRKPGGVRNTIAMHCRFKIFKMAAKVEKFRRLYALFFNRYSSFLRSFFSIS